MVAAVLQACNAWAPSCIFNSKLPDMNKLILTLLAGFFLANAAFSQAYEGIVEYDKKKQDAFLIDYSYSQEAVENAILKKMEKLGYKPTEEKGLFNKDKGFKIFKGAYVTEASELRMDYIIKVEQKSRKNKDESVISLILLRDGGNAKAGFGPDDMNRVKLFLVNLMPDIEAADLEIRIRNQEEAVAKAEKKLRDLKDEQSSLEKKLEQNKTDQETTQKDIETKKQELGTLIGRRKNN